MGNITKAQEELLRYNDKIKKDYAFNRSTGGKFHHLAKITTDAITGENGWIPVSNGNALAINEYISLYQNSDTLTFKIYLAHEEYFTNLYDVEGDDRLKRIWKALEVINWNYGCCAIVYNKKTNDIEPRALVAYKLNTNMEIIEGKSYINNVSFLSASPALEYKNINLKNSVFGRFNFRGIPAVFNWLPLSYQEANHIRSYLSNLWTNTTKLKYTVKNANIDAIQTEISSIYQVDKNIIFNIKDGGALGNDVPNEIEIMENKNSVNSDIMTELNKYRAYFYPMLGRRYSTLEKKERVSSVEVQQDEITYYTHENNWKTQHENMIERYNKMCKIWFKKEGTAKLVDGISKTQQEQASREAVKNRGGDMLNKEVE